MIRLAVRCRADAAERVLAELIELAPGGIEQEEAGEYVEFGIYGPPGELPALPDIEAAAGEGLVELSSTEIPDDWADRWRDFHEPIAVGGGRLAVRPSWHDPAGAPASEVDVVIDPGQAFGTGGHATTRMCLELLLSLADGGYAHGPLVDLGTGSGVLAIAAAKLGWAPVRGVDHEPAALDAAAANAAANDVEIELRRVNLRDEAPPVAPTVVANLTGPLLRDLASRLAADGPDRLVCSGLLASEAEGVAEAFGRAGFKPARQLADGEWRALRLEGG